MIQKTIKTYSFEELSEDAKNKALELYRDINIDDDNWTECIFEDFKQELFKLGYDDVKIYYSGFCSQGDGACFEATLDVKQWLKAHKLSNKYKAVYIDSNNVTVRIVQRGNYYHENSAYIDSYTTFERTTADNQWEEVEDLIEAERYQKSKELYKSLYEEYFNLLSDENVKEAIIANEYQFLENGSNNLFI